MLFFQGQKSRRVPKWDWERRGHLGLPFPFTSLCLPLSASWAGGIRSHPEWESILAFQQNRSPRGQPVNPPMPFSHGFEAQRAAWGGGGSYSTTENAPGVLSLVYIQMCQTVDGSWMAT